MNKENKDNEEIAPSGITRKDAIKKMGKYAALTALGTFMILNPKKAQATSARFYYQRLKSSQNYSIKIISNIFF